jgi:hypothetical protein
MQGPISKSYISLEGLRGGLLDEMLRAMDLTPRQVNGFDALTSEEQQVYLTAMETQGASPQEGEYKMLPSPSSPRASALSVCVDNQQYASCNQHSKEGQQQETCCSNVDTATEPASMCAKQCSFTRLCVHAFVVCSPTQTRDDAHLLLVCSSLANIVHKPVSWGPLGSRCGVIELVWHHLEAFIPSRLTICLSTSCCVFNPFATHGR